MSLRGARMFMCGKATPILSSELFHCRLVNRFIKKGSKTPDYSDKKVFGVPLSLILQRTGQPLPQCILHAMRYLRKSAPDTVGIFRKSGVKTRITKLRDDLEKDPGRSFIIGYSNIVVCIFITRVKEL